MDVRCDAGSHCSERRIESERTTHGLVAQSSYVFDLDITEKGRLLLVRKTDNGNELYLSCGTIDQSCDLPRLVGRTGEEARWVAFPARGPREQPKPQ